jgi:hypothetical protein
MSAVAPERSTLPASVRSPRLRPVPALEPPYDDELAAVIPLTGGPAPTLPFDDHDAPRGDDFDPQPTPRADLPDPARWAARLVQATVEVLAGRRPLQQLMPYTDDYVYAQLTGRLRRRRGPGRPPLLCSVHASEPRDGVAEVCAVVRESGRVRAIAARLEGYDGRWRCTALQLG